MKKNREREKENRTKREKKRRKGNVDKSEQVREDAGVVKRDGGAITTVMRAVNYEIP